MADQLSYGFVVFVGALCIANTILFLFARTSRWGDRILFWLFGTVLILFTGLRPYGVGLDDAGHYNLHYSRVCPLLECGKWLLKDRDYVWYFLISLLRRISSNPADMLWLSAMAVAIKLVIIDRLCSWRLLALILYAGVFYQVQDMTSFRQAWAILFFMLGFLGLSSRSMWAGSPFLLLSGLAHKQGFLSLALLPASWLPRRWYLPWVMMVLSFVLLFLGIFPKSGTLQANVVYIEPGSWLKLLRDIFGHLLDIKPSMANVMERIPLSTYPMAALVFFQFRRGWSMSDPALALAGVSCCLAFVWFWLFAAEPVYQFRFFYFFLVPLTVAVGRGERRISLLLLVIVISLAFTYRYNVSHRVFIDNARVDWSVEGPGEISTIGEYGLPCGEHCEMIGLGRHEWFVAKPSSGYALSQWAGACSGREPTCILEVQRDSSLRGSFVPAYQVTVKMAGNGQVVSAPGGIYCGHGKRDCELGFARDMPVTLKANSNTYFQFAGWEGDCSGIEPVCVMTMDGNKQVTARFDPRSSKPR
jgi:hypothetical protein